MKHIHFPTLGIHATLLLLARLMLSHYQDGFLIAAGLLLCGHVIYSCFSAKSPLLTHLLGCGVQAVCFALGILSVPQGLGSGLALFFYQIALAAVFVLEAIIGIIRHRRKEHR